MTDDALFAQHIRHALDESAQRLPYRVVQRLDRARLGALSAADRATERRHAPGLAIAGLGRLTPSSEPGWLYRALATLLPVLVVILGLYGIAAWKDAIDVAELADVDADLVLADDELPIEAFADRGFGVFLKNTRQ
jgi:hypothetical protein